MSQSSTNLNTGKCNKAWIPNFVFVIWSLETDRHFKILRPHGEVIEIQQINVKTKIRLNEWRWMGGWLETDTPKKEWIQRPWWWWWSRWRIQTISIYLYSRRLPTTFNDNHDHHYSPQSDDDDDDDWDEQKNKEWKKFHLIF